MTPALIYTELELLKFEMASPQHYLPMNAMDTVHYSMNFGCLIFDHINLARINTVLNCIKNDPIKNDRINFTTV
jgi:hypothetical protein